MDLLSAVAIWPEVMYINGPSRHLTSGAIGHDYSLGLIQYSCIRVGMHYFVSPPHAAISN